jgi:hypothetical protein
MHRSFYIICILIIQKFIYLFIYLFIFYAGHRTGTDFKMFI